MCLGATDVGYYFRRPRNETFLLMKVSHVSWFMSRGGRGGGGGGVVVVVAVCECVTTVVLADCVVS